MSSNGKMSHMNISPRVDPSTINKTFGDQVRKYRTKRELKQSEVAERLSEILEKPVNTSTVNRIENGARPTPLSEVYALSEVLKVSIHHLMPPEDQLAEAALPIFNAASETSSRIIQLGHEIRDLESRQRVQDRVISDYWILRGVRDAKPDTSWDKKITEDDFQKAIANFGFSLHEETGLSQLAQIAEAMKVPEETQRKIHEAEIEGDNQAIILLINSLTNLYKDRLNASS